MKKKAIVLLSGGLDSSTTLYYAINRGYSCQALIFDYGQKHKKEIKSALSIVKHLGVSYEILKITLPWKGSALIDNKMKIPNKRTVDKIGKDIPKTYVPGRNTIFLSYALSFAEATGSSAIFIGANVMDYSGYPDCRPEYLMAFELVIRKGGRDKNIRIFAPLINKTKEEILKLAVKLGVPIKKTWSCYNGKKKPCGVCDSCLIRKKAFDSAGLKDYN